MSLEARMEPLRLRFVERTRADAALIAEALAVMDLETLRRFSHRLSGNAGIFGHAGVGNLAERVETAIDDDRPAAEIRAKTERLLVALARL